MVLYRYGVSFVGCIDMVLAPCNMVIKEKL